jgi:hypothetical protein
MFVICFEDIQAFELLIENSKWLKALCFDHLCLEPVFDFILPLILEISVCIIKVSRGVSAAVSSRSNTTHRFNCSKVSYADVSWKQGYGLDRLTISSLHIGQASLELAGFATLAADKSPLSSDILDVRSWLSKEGGVERPESRERLLGEEVRRWTLDFPCCGD